MKKITLLFILTLFGYSGFAQISEAFESTTFPPTGWAVFIGANGLGTTESWEQQVFDTGTAVCIWEVLPAGQRSEDWLVTPQFTVLDTAPTLFFDSIDSGTTDYGSIYTVRVSTASQTTPADFTIIDTQNETQISHSQTTMVGSNRSVDLSAYIGQAIYIAFVLEQNDGDLWRIDNVLVGSPAAAPGPVTTPTPSDLAVDVFVDPTDSDGDTLPDMLVAFDWTPSATGEAATGYEVYLGDSPTTLQLLGTTPNDAVNITSIDYSTLYYWQIIAKNAGGSAVGSSIWSFTTEDDPNLSVGEESVNLFSVYPNPTKNQVSITTSLTIDSVEFYNQLGQRVMNVDGAGMLNNSINLSSLNTGLYYMNISAEGKKQTIKVVKQ